jgi:predicted ArsR family transcriptional regulator
MVRTLAHPLRAKLLALLRVEGPSTSSRLASRVGTNSGATSYHLRQLADAGLVEERSELGTGRERWWASAHDSHSWAETDHQDDPDTAAAGDWLVRYAHRQYGRRIDDWLDARSEWPPEWRRAAEMSDYQVRVSPEQLAELNARIHALVSEYEHASSDGETIGLIYYAFPYAAVSL